MMLSKQHTNINPRLPSTLQWCHNWRGGVSNHQPHDCLLNCLFRRRSTKTSRLRFTGLFAGNSSVIGEFPAQMSSNAENVSIWWRHHELLLAPDSGVNFTISAAVSGSVWYLASIADCSAVCACEIWQVLATTSSRDVMSTESNDKNTLSKIAMNCLYM